MEVQTTSSSAQMVHEPDPRRWLMLVVVLGAAFVDVLDNFIINIALPSIERELHASFAELQLVVSGYTLAYSVLLVTGGRLGDLYGRKRLFVLGIGSFTLFSALCGVAPTALLLIIFRIAQGAAAALMYPQVISFIQVSFDQSERPRAFGYYAAIAGLASILGQVFGGFLLTANLFNTGWRSIFLVNVPIGIVVLPAALLLLRESKMPEAHRLDYGGVSLLTLTLFLLVFPLVLGEGAGWSWWMLIGLLDAFFTASSGNPLRAFVISILVIVLLSLGLSLSVLPLAGSHPLTTESEAFMHEQKEETEQVHQREKRG